VNQMHHKVHRSKCHLVFLESENQQSHRSFQSFDPFEFVSFGPNLDYQLTIQDLDLKSSDNGQFMNWFRPE